MRLAHSSRLKAQRGKPGLARCRLRQGSGGQAKLKAQRFLGIFILLSAFTFQFSAFLTGCAHIKKYSQDRKRLNVLSAGNLGGLSKVDIVKRLGEPLAISKSEVSECWYYACPCEIWIWFTQDKVERWESK